jgi:copper chaperone CopZ
MNINNKIEPMNTIKFKTNLKCAGCMYAIKPFMDQIKGVKSWNVDLDDPDKTVTVESETAQAEEIKYAISKAGYTAEQKK